MSSRAYCFTINNPTDDDFLDVITLHDVYSCQYLIFGFEVGTEGTFHIQGYVYYPNAILFTTVKSLIPRAHIEVSKGTVEQNTAYCSKDGDYYSAGIAPTQGRAKYERIKQAMLDPRNDPQIHHQYRKSFREMEMCYPPEDKPRLAYHIYTMDFIPLCQYFVREKISFCDDVEHYYNEKVLFVRVSDESVRRGIDKYVESDVLMWTIGAPRTRRYGYEMMRVDPDEIIFIISSHFEGKKGLKKNFPYPFYIEANATRKAQERYEEILAEEIWAEAQSSSEESS